MGQTNSSLGGDGNLSRHNNSSDKLASQQRRVVDDQTLAKTRRRNGLRELGEGSGNGQKPEENPDIVKKITSSLEAINTSDNSSSKYEKQRVGELGRQIQNDSKRALDMYTILPNKNTQDTNTLENIHGLVEEARKQTDLALKYVGRNKLRRKFSDKSTAAAPEELKRIADAIQQQTKQMERRIVEKFDVKEFDKVKDETGKFLKEALFMYYLPEDLRKPFKDKQNDCINRGEECRSRIDLQSNVESNAAVVELCSVTTELIAYYKRTRAIAKCMDDACFPEGDAPVDINNRVGEWHQSNEEVYSHIPEEYISAMIKLEQKTLPKSKCILTSWNEAGYNAESLQRKDAYNDFFAELTNDEQNLIKIYKGKLKAYKDRGKDYMDALMKLSGPEDSLREEVKRAIADLEDSQVKLENEVYKKFEARKEEREREKAAKANEESRKRIKFEENFRNQVLMTWDDFIESQNRSIRNRDYSPLPQEAIEAVKNLEQELALKPTIEEWDAIGNEAVNFRSQETYVHLENSKDSFVEKHVSRIRTHKQDGRDYIIALRQVYNGEKEKTIIGYYAINASKAAEELNKSNKDMKLRLDFEQNLYRQMKKTSNEFLDPWIKEVDSNLSLAFIEAVKELKQLSSDQISVFETLNKAVNAAIAKKGSGYGDDSSRDNDRIRDIRELKNLGRNYIYDLIQDHNISRDAIQNLHRKATNVQISASSNVYISYDND